MVESTYTARRELSSTITKINSGGLIISGRVGRRISFDTQLPKLPRSVKKFLRLEWLKKKRKKKKRVIISVMQITDTINESD